MLGRVISTIFAIWGLFVTGVVGRVDRPLRTQDYICAGCVPRDQIIAPGIGIDLSSTYGTVAIRYHNQTIVDVGRIDGTQQYNEMMRRALPPYHHRGPPFNTIKERLDYEYEQLQRVLRKARGLPESPDTEVLSEMLYQLHLLASLHSDVPVPNAVFVSAASMLNFPYGDFEAAFPFANLTKLRSFRRSQFRAETQLETGFVGMNYGLCKHWANFQECSDEERSLPPKSVLAITYLDDVLEINHAWSKSAYTLWPDLYVNYPEYGYASYNRTTREKEYWNDIKLRITTVIHASRIEPDTLILLGERATETKFMEVVWEALKEIETPQLYNRLQLPEFDPERLNARGAAELAKRAQGEPKGCIEGDWCNNRRKGEDGVPELAEGDEYELSDEDEAPLPLTDENPGKHEWASQEPLQEILAPRSRRGNKVRLT